MDLLRQRIETEGAAFDLSEWTRQVPELAASTIQVSLIDADAKLVATTLMRTPSRSIYPTASISASTTIATMSACSSASRYAAASPMS